MAGKVEVDDEENPPFTIMESSIIKIANAFEEIEKSQLQQRVIILLLEDMTGLSQKTIKTILDAAPLLKSKYLKEKKEL